MTENTDDLWLRQWLLCSLKFQLEKELSLSEDLKLLSQRQPSQHFVIGMSGAQGSGKSSLAAALQQLWLTLGVQTDVVSLDDYYLEPEDRLKRARLWHPLFAERGVPGTHDIRLLLSQIQAFKGKEPQHWRRYDKGLDRVMEPAVGHGIDSSIDSTATGTQATTARLLILEGWCVGLKAQQGSALRRSINTLEQHQDPDMQWRRHVNQQLAGDYQLLWQELQSLIWLQAPDWLAVCRWRGWQELALQQQGRGKTPTELEHFMLYFQRLTEESWRQLPDCSDFILFLDQQHNFIRLIPDELAVDE